MMPIPFLGLPTRILALPAAKLRLIGVTGIALLLIVASVKYLQKAAKPSDLGTYTRTAFLRWRPQLIGGAHADGRPILGLMQGADAYRLYNYPNPPIMALILWPFLALPPLIGAMTWFYAKSAMAVLGILWVFRLVSGTGPPLPAGAKLLAVALAAHPILGDLSHGNVNIFIAFLVLATLELVRRQHDFAAGLTLSLAVACKVTPALFIPYFFWKRAWRLVLASVAGLVLWWLLVPGLVFGMERNSDLLTGWYEMMVRPFLIDGKVTSEHANQSIPGVVYRLLTREPSVIDYDENDHPFAASFHNLVDVGPENARLIIRLCQGIFVLLVIGLCRPTLQGPRERQGLRFAAECALILLGTLLFSERTWKHHAVGLILPVTVVIHFLSLRTSTQAFRGMLAGILLVVTALMLLPALFGGTVQDQALTYGSHTAAFLLLSVAVCGILRSERLGDQNSPRIGSPV
jgi:alpha-1,2-mannosyltransferase